MACSLLQKLSLMPGCRPWDTPDPVQTDTSYQFQIPGVSTQSPWAPPDLSTGEFSIVQAVQTTVSNAAKNVSRLVSSNNTVIDQGTSPAWYDVSGRISQAAGATGEFVQSTLLKVIILVTIVGVIAIFGMSYVQTKGANLAK